LQGDCARHGQPDRLRQHLGRQALSLGCWDVVGWVPGGSSGGDRSIGRRVVVAVQGPPGSAQFPRGQGDDAGSVGSSSATRRSEGGSRSSVKPSPPSFAAGLARATPWHLDEVFITIHGKTHYLWRAVAQNGARLGYPGPTAASRGGREEVLPPPAHGVAVCTAGDGHRQAAQLRGRTPGGLPLVTHHRQSRYLNNRAENSHQPTR
jgi:hypothetical protein